ncbi:dethiobiotin synthase [Bradyrhizobium sp. 197]|uniref:ATP-dependent dethiobiotin synthetase BioD n=1 Tax=Bradyrhizobium sp. 197 TaxID=2782663 RepID=UPI001FF9F798|nr:ATP-dependent dethiobiotin synthetase BioD [Bradyrhizobium sp. 197]MCK1476247.1 dethiobiotin synthase [Bradyrhizobium sp. 197]
MRQRIVVTGTDTGIGKSVFSAGLAHLLGANYWKPIQAGVEGETDSEQVARLSGLPADRIVPERYRLKTSASPHHAAEIDGIRIDPDSLVLPHTGERPLVIEGAGGLMVPLNSSSLLKNLEMENFHFSAGRFWNGAVELDVISSLLLSVPRRGVAMRRAVLEFGSGYRRSD